MTQLWKVLNGVKGKGTTLQVLPSLWSADFFYKTGDKKFPKSQHRILKNEFALF